MSLLLYDCVTLGDFCYLVSWYQIFYNISCCGCQCYSGRRIICITIGERNCIAWLLLSVDGKVITLGAAKYILDSPEVAMADEMMEEIL